MKIPATEYIPGVSQFCLKEWQDIWNCCEGSKLHAIYPNVGRIPHCKNLSRRDIVEWSLTDYDVPLRNCSLTHSLPFLAVNLDAVSPVMAM